MIKWFHTQTQIVLSTLDSEQTSFRFLFISLATCICCLVSVGSKIWALLSLDLDQLVSMCPVVFVYVFNFKYFSGLVSSAPHSHELLHGHELPVDVLRRPTLTHRSCRGKYNFIIFITPNYFVVINKVVKGVLYFPRCLPKILPDSSLKST